MKLALITLLLCSVSLAADRIAPNVKSIDPDELLPSLHAKGDFRSHAPTIRRGLVGTQLTYRAESAQWFIKHGTVGDVPFLIDSLSDESMHVGATYPLAGMATTRYWANVALIVICKTSYDYQWDASKEKREVFNFSLETALGTNQAEEQKIGEQAGATNRLPAASRKLHDHHNLNLEIESALPVACGRPLTLNTQGEK